MQTHLISQFYLDSNEQRQAELLHCIEKNQEAGFHSYTLLVENEKVEKYLKEMQFSGIIINVGRRPTFNDFFKELQKVKRTNVINIIANSDIYFEDIEVINSYYFHVQHNPKICLALSRYDVNADGGITPFLRPDSQDAWIFYSNPEIRTSIEFGMGEAGCDNRLAWELQQRGFQLHNPSHSIRIFHYHPSNVRNYLGQNNEPTHRIPPPYVLVTPF